MGPTPAAWAKIAQASRLIEGVRPALTPGKHVLDFREQGGKWMVRVWLIGAVVLAASAGHALAQDLAAGESSFRKCQPCHDVGETAKNKLGPELNGLDGRKAGTIENGTYSQGMRNSGITWNEQAFREFVSN